MEGSLLEECLQILNIGVHRFIDMAYSISIWILKIGSVIAVFVGLTIKEPFYIILGIIGIIGYQLHRWAMRNKP